MSRFLIFGPIFFVSSDTRLTGTDTGKHGFLLHLIFFGLPCRKAYFGPPRS